MITWLLSGANTGAGTLVWTTEPLWVALGAVAAVIAWTVALLSRRTGTVSMGARVAEAVLFALALAVLVIAVAGPELVEEDGREEVGKLVVLVDGSGSMGVADGTKPRSTGAVEAVDKVREGCKFDDKVGEKIDAAADKMVKDIIGEDAEAAAE